MINRFFISIKKPQQSKIIEVKYYIVTDYFAIPIALFSLITVTLT